MGLVDSKVSDGEDRSMNTTRVLGGAFAALLLAPVVADDSKEPPTWEGEGELGYSRSTGNTETESLTARLGVKREGPVWRVFLNVEGVNKSDNSASVAERYYAAGKADYKLTARGYLFARVDYEDDRFSGYDYRSNVAVGYGHRLIDWSALVLSAEVGPGVRASRVEGGDSDTTTTGRIAADLLWHISEHSKFTTAASAVRGGGSTDYRSLSAVTAKLNSYLALRVSYLYKHSTEVPPGHARTDTETGVTLVYGF